MAGQLHTRGQRHRQRHRQPVPPPPNSWPSWRTHGPKTRLCAWSHRTFGYGWTRLDFKAFFSQIVMPWPRDRRSGRSVRQRAYNINPSPKKVRVYCTRATAGTLARKDPLCLRRGPGRGMSSSRFEFVVAHHDRIGAVHIYTAWAASLSTGLGRLTVASGVAFF